MRLLIAANNQATRRNEIIKSYLQLGSSSNRYAPRLPQQETKSSTKQLAPTDPILGPENLLKTGFAQKGLPSDLHVVATPEGLILAIRLALHGETSGEKQTRLSEGAVDYDARDVIECARTHPPSPVSNTEMPVLDDAKRGQADQGFVSHKSARLDTVDNLGEGTALDDSEPYELESKVPRASPQGSPSLASA